MFHKKSLGQHFLRDTRILQKIADAAALSPTETVVEVGPGEGTLTALLLERAGKVVAVEKDDRLVPILERKFQKEIADGRLTLMHADVLELSSAFYPLPSGYKIVANLPYYITGQFFRKFLEETRNPPLSMTLLLQKEVAERIVARDGKESILSISIEAYGTPKFAGTVKAGSFSPPPKVDSAILCISSISKAFFDGISEAGFFETLRTGFSHPRKFVASNLGLDSKAVQALGIDEKARAETLSLTDWKKLTALREKACLDPNCPAEGHR